MSFIVKKQKSRSMETKKTIRCFMSIEIITFAVLSDFHDTLIILILFKLTFLDKTLDFLNENF